jgi:hypothetical protein
VFLWSQTTPSPCVSNKTLISTNYSHIGLYINVIYFGGKRESQIPLGRTTIRVESKIKMDIQEIVWGAWTGLIWLRLGTDGRRL